MINIGCIECGVSSNIVGVFADKKRADDIATACSKNYSWREGGQNNFEVFELPEPEIINPEYERLTKYTLKRMKRNESITQR